MVPHSDLPSKRAFVVVFAGLAVLTAVNVGLSYLPSTHPGGIGGKIVVATLQCGVMAHFLLNLRGENRMVSYTILAALFLIVSLIGTLIPDIGILGR